MAEALPGELNYLIDECQRVTAENAAIRSRAETIMMKHTSSVREYTTTMTALANTIKQSRTEIVNLLSTVGVKKETESTLQQRIAELETFSSNNVKVAIGPHSSWKPSEALMSDSVVSR